MVGPTAQIVALTCYLNARIRKIPVAAFFPANSTCRFCEYIHFARRKRRLLGRSNHWEVIATSPDEWMQSVAVERHALRAVIVHQPTNRDFISDRVSAGLAGGGGDWFLCVRQNDGYDCWQPAWRVGNRAAPEKRIWQVQYHLVEERHPFEPRERLPAAVASELSVVLTEIASFADRHDQAHYAGQFRNALSCLSDDAGTPPVDADIVPEGLIGAPAARLLAASQAAWVFGGMGSWNDLGLSGDKEYNELSDRLFRLLNEAICVGANESGTPRK